MINQHAFPTQPFRPFYLTICDIVSLLLKYNSSSTVTDSRKLGSLIIDYQVRIYGI